MTNEVSPVSKVVMSIQDPVPDLFSFVAASSWCTEVKQVPARAPPYQQPAEQLPGRPAAWRPATLQPHFTDTGAEQQLCSRCW